MPESIPEDVADDPADEQVFLQLALGDVVRLQALLASLEDGTDEAIVAGWSSKLIGAIQEQAEIDIDDVAAFDDDVTRIIDADLGTPTESNG